MDIFPKRSKLLGQVGWLSKYSRLGQARAREPRDGTTVSGFWFLVPVFWFLVSGFGFRVSCFEFQVSGFGFQVSGFGFRVSGIRFRNSGFGFRLLCFGFRVSNFRVTHLSLEVEPVALGLAAEAVKRACKRTQSEDYKDPDCPDVRAIHSVKLVRSTCDPQKKLYSQMGIKTYPCIQVYSVMYDSG